MTFISIFKPTKKRFMYHFGKNAYAELNQWIEKISPSQILVIDDENTHKYCYPLLKKELKTTHLTISVSPGEKHKTLQTAENLWKEMMSLELDRHSLIINLGGGIITDLGGFVASTFKRGMPFIHIPTSLLGMVDASIGGKNGVNFLDAKNQIGVIIPPEMILFDRKYLETLPPEELKSGFAEMLKHGLIADPEYWNELIEDGIANIPNNEMIKKSVDIKHNIISSDPTEKGLRKVLNFGHTLGHAIESNSYNTPNPLTHGHAVALGMILASYLSYLKFNLPFTFVNSIKNSLLNIYSLPEWTNEDIRKIFNYLKYDKKNISGKIRFVLLQDIAKPVWDQEVSHDQIIEAFDFLKA